MESIQKPTHHATSVQASNSPVRTRIHTLNICVLLLLILRFRILSLLECLSLSIFGDKNEWLRRAIALCSQLKQVVCWLLFHRTVQSSGINRDKFAKKNLFNKSSENRVSNDWMPNKSGRLKSPNKIKLQIIASENSVLKSHKTAKYLWIMRFLLTIRHPKCSDSLLIVAHWTNKWKKKRKHEKLNKKQNYNDHKNLNILFEREMRQQLHRQTKSTRKIHTENRIKTAAKHNQPRAKNKN